MKQWGDMRHQSWKLNEIKRGSTRVPWTVSDYVAMARRAGVTPQMFLRIQARKKCEDKELRLREEICRE